MIDKHIKKNDSRNFRLKKIILKYFVSSFLFISLIIIVWFLFTLPRIKEKLNYYPIVQQMKYQSLISIPDTIPKIKTMPNFDQIDWKKLSPGLDSDGVKLTDYDKEGIRGVSGLQKYPYTIAGFAEYQISEYLKTGNKTNLLLSLRQLDYLAKEFHVKKINGEEIGLWYVNFDLGYQYNVKAPWRSAFNQASCLEAMVYAYQITGDSQYLNMFEKGINALRYSTEEGGLSYKTRNGGLFFQEVVTPYPLHHILNGKMDVLIKVYRCAEVTKSTNAKEVFNLGIVGLKDMLPNFDRYGYSLYSLSPNPSFVNHFNIASPSYHSTHIGQLRVLGKISGEKMFLEYADKWQSETGGIKEFLWITIYVMFKDFMKTIKSVESDLGINITGN